MDISKAINEVCRNYVSQGFDVFPRPKRDDLPDFAKDFHIDVLARTTDVNVLIVIKRNRHAFAEDPEMQRYAKITTDHPGWRFDFVLFEGDKMQVEGIHEPSEDDLKDWNGVAQELLKHSWINAAFTTAWALTEAAMRRRLQAEQSRVGWGTPPNQLLSDLVTNGMITVDEFDRLRKISRVRNEIVHGFARPNVTVEDIEFLLKLSDRLIDDSKTPLVVSD